MMKEKQSSNFFLGFILGLSIGVAIWYWQKSTAADEGALDLLDRLQASERKLRSVQERLARAAAEAPPEGETETADDLKRINGVGDVYADRLWAAGITTLADVVATPVEKLAEVMDTFPSRAAKIQQNASLMA